MNCKSKRCLMLHSLSKSPLLAFSFLYCCYLSYKYKSYNLLVYSFTFIISLSISLNNAISIFSSIRHSLISGSCLLILLCTFHRSKLKDFGSHKFYFRIFYYHFTISLMHWFRWLGRFYIRLFYFDYFRLNLKLGYNLRVVGSCTVSQIGFISIL